MEDLGVVARPEGVVMFKVYVLKRERGRSNAIEETKTITPSREAALAAWRDLYDVITSYSIHYTKLYDFVQPVERLKLVYRVLRDQRTAVDLELVQRNNFV